MRFLSQYYSIATIFTLLVLHCTSVNAVEIKNIIAGQYVCQGAKVKIKRKLTLIENPQHIDDNKRFYTYNIYFSGNADNLLNDGKKVFSNAIGYMIVDTQKLTGIGYLENQIDSRIRGAGLVEFNIFENKPVKFSAYFINKFTDSMGQAYCEKLTTPDNKKAQ
ncbi:hypothetical protein [uncultured Shewanella sp.]|uniref:hypothetical protein n=1 Tax=uncultured Shewanella sp. TaxID=173975 RepID=UPI00261BFA0F|nr:hypothetical protein [uncultured Shewanella sp.]